MYICYLHVDASKAFDRNVPTIAVRLLCTWYTTHQFNVKWGLSLSSCFYVSNGVFGVVFSPPPILFNIYITDLSTGLTKLKIGCNFNGVFVNHLVYADGTVLLAPLTLSSLKPY